MTRPLYPEERNALKVMFADAGVRPVLDYLSRLCHIRVAVLQEIVGDAESATVYQELEARLTDLTIALTVS